MSSMYNVQAPVEGASGTTVRVFKILQWLLDGPLSVEELNERFSEEPGIFKSFSNDSIGLYINTLKQLGCKIKRPSKKNGFRYELLAHPFGMTVSPKEVQILIRLKIIAEEALPYRQILKLDSLLKKIFQWASLSEQEKALKELFVKSRSIDYTQHLQLIEQLEVAIVEQRPVMLTYDSPIHGVESFPFLPQSLGYLRGALYLKGLQHERTQLSWLRTEKIHYIEPLNNERIVKALKIVAATPAPMVRLRLLRSSVGLDSKQCDVEFQTRDFFSLWQQLVEYDSPFQVLDPPALKQHLRNTLEKMLGVYQA